ncbi:hypothetical protein C4546_04450 [Candidatus Parcubacteria bacterium]|jgi:hypothetical protein|nr:MAG: hypothetical protein C4546_04450 [Candidatus Parcubacteria bacterium]
MHFTLFWLSVSAVSIVCLFRIDKHFQKKALQTRRQTLYKNLFLTAQFLTIFFVISALQFLVFDAGAYSNFMSALACALLVCLIGFRADSRAFYCRVEKLREEISTTRV